MCGIGGVACFGSERPTRALIEAVWKAQEPRGRDASGIAYLGDDGATRLLKGAFPVSDLIPQIPEDAWGRILRSPVVLFHARQKTKGEVSINENNHPVVGCNWIITHNGMISNDDELWESLGEGQTRPGTVDSSAINLVLAQGGAEEEEVGRIGVLSGGATFAGWRQDSPRRIILARGNGGAELHLVRDRTKEILYWSSAEAGARIVAQDSFAGIPLGIGGTLPAKTALVIDTEGRKARRYQVEPAYFFRPRKTTKSGGSEWPRTDARTNFPAGSFLGDRYGNKPSETPAAPRGEGSTKDGFYPLEDYRKLGKPEPILNGLPLGWHGNPGSRLNIIVPTPTGRWIFDERGDRTFRPHKRIRNFWAADLFVPSLVLPASSEDQEDLDGTAPLERVKMVQDRVVTTGYMCPWCGVINSYDAWMRVWNNRCAWCMVLCPLLAARR